MSPRLLRQVLCKDSFLDADEPDMSHTFLVQQIHSVGSQQRESGSHELILFAQRVDFVGCIAKGNPKGKQKGIDPHCLGVVG